jgi:hypothetical protein
VFVENPNVSTNPVHCDVAEIKGKVNASQLEVPRVAVKNLQNECGHVLNRNL